MAMHQLSASELQQRRYYNEIAVTYDKHYSNKFALQYRYGIYDGMLQGLSLERFNVLDAMCGGGENTGYFLSKGATVTGVDISERQCEIYQNRFPLSKVVCTTVTQTPFPDKHFDMIVTESLHHLHPEVSKGVAELHRLLKPGGYLLIWEPSAGSILDLMRKAWYKFDSKYFRDNEHSISLKRLVRDQSEQFTLEKYRYGGNIGYLFVHSSMHFRIPVKWIDTYASALLSVERLLMPLQTKLTACWVLALFRKKSFDTIE
jgi:SAM-dependent methyltransferase